ncbi:MAG: hypothetical protein KAW17_09340 [Candidatus Eisenbacteria sp.]|nr:hypothetical protein [Candidatus Eisenbacteria bacterium]
MVHISKDLAFSERTAREHGVRSMQHSVARIYGPPDDAVMFADSLTWYYMSEGIAFVFDKDSIEKVIELHTRGK